MMREREKFKEGKAEGIIDFALDLGYSDEQILTALQKTLEISLDQAEDYLQKFHDENR